MQSKATYEFAVERDGSGSKIDWGDGWMDTRCSTEERKKI